MCWTGDEITSVSDADLDRFTSDKTPANTPSCALSKIYRLTFYKSGSGAVMKVQNFNHQNSRFCKVIISASKYIIFFRDFKTCKQIIQVLDRVNVIHDQVISILPNLLN